MATRRELTAFTRYGGWIPSDDRVYRGFHNRLALFAHEKYGKFKFGHHNPAVQAFADAINKLGPGEEKSRKKITNFDQLLYALDNIIVKPPEFEVVEDENDNPVGEPVGVPIYLLLDIPSNTAAAYDLFRLPAFNEAMRALLKSWGEYLSKPDGGSNSSLNTGPTGWFSEAGMKKLREQGRIPDGPNGFTETYVSPDSDPEQGFGYRSWDEFFVREFQQGARPLYIPDDPEIAVTLIHSACESTCASYLKFWLKGQPYSLYDMLDNDPGPSGVKRADQFIDGTVYQGFLSPQDFHRWHAPVDGKIVDGYILDGSYYAVIPDEGAEIGDPDLVPGDPRGGLIRSQPFLTLSATRAIIFIEADNPLIGLMCFVGVGMCEVSTCELSQKVKNKEHVKVGDELGMSHFGGSSHVMIFNNK
ncbi:Phophatidylserine decarboxylase-domain-containing protein, partial [Amanita rubescens]